MKKHTWVIIFLMTFSLSFKLQAQEKPKERLFDNRLGFAITQDQIREKGRFEYCIMDTTSSFCISNLTTGMAIRVYDANNRLLWMGRSSGGSKKLGMPFKMPEAEYLTLTAFKPYVVNKTTANRIHQDKNLFLKYYIK